MPMAMIENEVEEEEKKRREKEHKKEEMPKMPEIQDKKERIQKGLEKEMKYGESKPLTQIEYPEIKGILDTGQIYTKREPVIHEESVVRLREEERKREEMEKQRKKEIEREKPKRQRQLEKTKKDEARKRRNRENEFIQKEAKRRAMREKKDVKKIAEELRRKGMITSIRNRMVSRSRRGQKKLKLIKKLLSRIKIIMK